MKTYKEPITEILANLQSHQQVIFGTSHPIFIEVLIKLANTYPEKQYFIAYDGAKDFIEKDSMEIKIRLNDLAKMYSAFDFPDNILFEEKFAELIQEYKKVKLN